MNYLGHIYFSNNDLELMHANIFGDFVKGKNLQSYDPLVQNGILLHRKIDDYIDHHPAVKSLVLQLSPSLPKVSGIAVDVYFDHFLTLHWKRFHSKELVDFLSDFYLHTIDERLYPNEQFLYMMMRLKHEKWLSTYATVQGVSETCAKISRRISFPNSLMNAGMVLEQNYKKIEQVFFEFMEDAQIHFTT